MKKRQRKTVSKWNKKSILIGGLAGGNAMIWFILLDYLING